MTGPKRHAKTADQERWIKNKLTIIVITILSVLLIVDTLPVGGNIRFYAKWISCGQKPVSTDTDWDILRTVDHYVESNAYPSIRKYAKFYCTPHDAKMDGYSAGSHSLVFPHLNADELKKAQEINR